MGLINIIRIIESFLAVFFFISRKLFNPTVLTRKKTIKQTIILIKLDASQCSATSRNIQLSSHTISLEDSTNVAEISSIITDSLWKLLEWRNSS